MVKPTDCLIDALLPDPIHKNHIDDFSCNTNDLSTNDAKNNLRQEVPNKKWAPRTNEAATWEVPDLNLILYDHPHNEKDDASVQIVFVDEKLDITSISSSSFEVPIPSSVFL